MNKPSQRGSAIIMLFIAVALFGMLAYAFSQGSRSGLGWVDKERGNAAATASQDCSNAIDMAMRRLEVRGCGPYISLNSDGSNTIPGAPQDGSCSVYHVNGGGAKACTGVTTSTLCTTTVIGDSCPDGTVYAGISPDGSARMYAQAADAGAYTWNNGNNLNRVAAGTTSSVTGFSNTATISTSDSDSATPGIQTNLAASFCENLTLNGYNDWYLPSLNELLVLYTNATAIGGFNQSGSYPAGYYWSSTEIDQNSARSVRFSVGTNHSSAKTDARSVRCVRKD